MSPLLRRYIPSNGGGPLGKMLAKWALRPSQGSTMS